MYQSALTVVRAEAGRKGGINSAALHPRSKEYLSSIAKGHGRPRRLSYSEMMNGGNGNHSNALLKLNSGRVKRSDK